VKEPLQVIGTVSEEVTDYAERFKPLENVDNKRKYFTFLNK